MTITSSGPGLASLTEADAVERARDLVAGIASRREDGDELRRIPDATMADLVASGLMRINQPARWGGPELGTEAAVKVIAEIARGDASTGWVFSILATHYWLIGLFSAEVQEEIWGHDPNAMMSSSFARSEGSAERVDGGYRISGRWPWSSGSDHCTWAMVGILCDPPVDGPPEVRWGLVPRSDYEVGDDWRTVSLLGTGSNTLIVRDAFVPDHRCIDPWDVSRGCTPGASVNQSPLFRLPFGPALAFYLAAPALGAAEQTFDDWVEYIGAKREAFTGAEVGKQAPTLIRAGELAAKLESARLLMTQTARAIDDGAAKGELPTELRVRAGRNATFAVRQCVEVVESCMQFSGGRGLFESHPVQRGWRDVHGVAAHYGFTTDNAYGSYGNVLLGLPVPPSPML